MLKFGCSSFLVVASAATTLLAQQPARLDQKALLAQTRSAYYLPEERGVQGFSCGVSFDWNAVLERASGRKIPPKEPTLVALRSATTTVTDDVTKGAEVKAAFAGGPPLAGTPVASRQRILNNLVKASLEGWNPFLSDRVFPMEGTKYLFEAEPTGYKLTLDGGTFVSILHLDEKLKVMQGESHLNGTTTEFIPAFDPSTHGWLLTSLKTVTKRAVGGSVAENKAESSSAEPEDEAGQAKASFSYSYQFVGDMLVPKVVVVQYGDGLETPYQLTDCSLIKISTGSAESKATKP